MVLGRESPPKEVVQRVHAIIERQTNDLTEITDDLLDVSRFCRGKVELQIKRIDLRVAVEEAIEMTQSLFNEKSHHFQTLLPPQSVWVDADRLRVAQLTANLLGNAAKYTPAGGRNLVSEIDRTESEAQILGGATMGLDLIRPMPITFCSPSSRWTCLHSRPGWSRVGIFNRRAAGEIASRHNHRRQSRPRNGKLFHCLFAIERHVDR